MPSPLTFIIIKKDGKSSIPKAMEYYGMRDEPFKWIVPVGSEKAEACVYCLVLKLKFLSNVY